MVKFAEMDTRVKLFEQIIDLQALRRAEDDAILIALQRQQDVGLDVFTDGEFRRDSWQTNFMQAVEGFAKEYPALEVTLPGGARTTIHMHSKAVEGPLVVRERLAQVDAARRASAKRSAMNACEFRASSATRSPLRTPCASSPAATRWHTSWNSA